MVFPKSVDESLILWRSLNAKGAKKANFREKKKNSRSFALFE